MNSNKRLTESTDTIFWARLSIILPMIIWLLVCYQVQYLIILISAFCGCLLALSLMFFFNISSKISLEIANAFSVAGIVTLLVPIGFQWHIVAIIIFLSVFLGYVCFGGAGNQLLNTAALSVICILTLSGFVSELTIVDGNKHFQHIMGDFLVSFSDHEISYNLILISFGIHPEFTVVIPPLFFVFGSIFSIILKVVDWRAMVTYLLFVSAGIFVMEFPMIRIQEIFLPLMVGTIFMVTDNLTTPVRGIGRMLFGTGSGITTAFLFSFSNYNNIFSMTLGILFWNFLSPLINELFRFRHLRRIRKED